MRSLPARVRMPRADRRAQILGVASELISQRGYWGLSLNDVANTCGLSLPGLLHHFDSKAALLVAVLDHRDGLDAGALAGRLGISADMAAAEDWSIFGVTLAEVCTAVVDRNAEQREIVRLYSVLEAESLTPDHPAQEYFRERQRRALLWFAQLAPPGVDPENTARAVLALLDGLQIQWLRDPDIDLRRAWVTASRQVPSLDVSASGRPFP